MATPLRLKRLFIEKLFGEGSHDIDITFKLDERVTILHGLNGSGKTITLNLLQAVWEGRYEALLAYPLKVMRLEFDDGSVLELRPERAGKKATQKASVSGRLTRLEQEPVSAMLGRNSSDYDRAILKVLAESGVRVLTNEATSGVLLDSGEWVRLRDLEKRYASILRGHPKLLAFPKGEPQVFQSLRGSLPSIQFIRTDRLRVQDEDKSKDNEQLSLFGHARTPPSPVYMVELLSARLRDEVQAADQAYRVASTELDTSLAERILEPPADVPSTDALLQNAAALSDLEARLRAVGLFTHTTKPLPRKISEHQRATIHIILQDREAKLRPFEALVNKAERLLKSLNQKLAPKQVKLDLNRGYQVLAASGEVLDLTQLSSGEQHELVLLHELLFDVRPGSLILIDEPELSLHVTWQATLLEELLDIARLVGLDFVLATHSPYIIGEHHELMVQLGRSVGDAP